MDLADGQIELREIIAETDDIKTVLIQGHNGVDSTPQHKGSTDTVYLPGRYQLAGILALEKKPPGWHGVLDQF